MKQRIDFDQWNSLSTAQKLKLDEYLMENYKQIIWSINQQQYEYVPKRLMTIGEMIEFLDNHKHRIILERNLGLNEENKLTDENQWSIQAEGWEKSYPPSLYVAGGIDLCDILWELVKEVLKQNTFRCMNCLNVIDTDPNKDLHKCNKCGETYLIKEFLLVKD